MPLMPKQYIPVFCVVIMACHPAPLPPLDQQVYIWQRQWSSEHAPALQQSQHVLSTLRVLAAQIHPREGLIQAHILPALLQHDGRPVIAVMRLDGQLPQLEQARILSQLQQIIQQWQSAGINLQGIEIDHDCATARLAQYRHLLQAIRQQLPKPLTLSITTLPTWMNSPLLPEILHELDSSVLQVHAVLQPSKGLFDAHTAQNWIRQYQQLSPRPFYVALPAYSIGLTPSGQVESEVVLSEWGERQEQGVDPQEMVKFITELQQQRYSQLHGLVWFRLPLVHDQRAWSWPTLQAVIQQQPLAPLLVLQASYQKGVYDLILTNMGTLKSTLPLRIEIAGQACQVGDGLGGYRVNVHANQVVFLRRQQQSSLAVNARFALGWVRCQSLAIKDVIYVDDSAPQ